MVSHIINKEFPEFWLDYYLSLLAMMRSITLPEVLSSEPSVAVIFLIAMINPSIASY